MRRRPLVLLLSPLLVVAACGAGTARPPDRTPGAAAGAGSAAPPPAPSALPATCPAEPKDDKEIGACVADCDRGLSDSCATAAASLERQGAKVGTFTRAVSLHERACQLENAASCVSAARMHAAGMGVPPSREKQMELLARACTLGDAFSCVVPAKAYANGVGVAKDERRARELYEKGCAGGAPAACAAIGEGAE